MQKAKAVISISNCQDLQKIPSGTSELVELSQDIDCAGISNFKPIPEFKGEFDGNDFVIRNIKINPNNYTNRYNAIFKNLIGAHIHDLKILDPKASGNRYTAILAATANNSIFKNIELTNAYISSNEEMAGALVAYTNNSSSFESITISNSSVSAHKKIGMLSGYVEDSHAEDITINQGMVSGFSSSMKDIGGIFGDAKNIIIKSSTINRIGVSGTYNMGLVAGRLQYSSVEDMKVEQDNLHCRGNKSCKNIGYIAGQSNESNINLVKVLKNNFRNSLNSDNYIYNVGGIVGNAFNTNISNSIAEFEMGYSWYKNSPGYCSVIGGLVGYMYNNKPVSISKSFANFDFDINTRGNGHVQSIGGLIGYSKGENANSRISINESYATGSIRNITRNIGGLIGLARHTNILNSYSDMDLGYRFNYSDRMGGIIGYNDNGNTINKTYSASSKLGPHYNTQYQTCSLIGDYGGNSSGSLIDSFSLTTGTNFNQNSNFLFQGIEKNSTEMKQAASFIDHNWDFDNIWTIEEGESYPKLRNVITEEYFLPNTIPIANAVADKSVGPKALTVNFDASNSSDPDSSDTISEYIWDPGDSSSPVITSLPEFTHSYLAIGNYHPTLIVKDNHGKESLPFNVPSITVLEPLPVVEAKILTEISEGVEHASKVFMSADGSSGDQDPEGDLLTYTWEFGDGDIETGIGLKNIEHQYLFQGAYTPKLTVNNNSGLSSSVNLATINVYEAEDLVCTVNCLSTPFQVISEYLEANSYLSLRGSDLNSADIPVDTLEEDLVYRFSLIDLGADIVNPSSELISQELQKEAAFFITNPGNYRVKMEIFNGVNKISHYEEDLTINEENLPPLITAVQSENTGIAPLSLNFDASLTNDPDNDELIYIWNFGDGQKSEGLSSSVNHSYDNPGIYKASLIVKDSRNHFVQHNFNDITVNMANVAPTAKIASSIFDCELITDLAAAGNELSNLDLLMNYQSHQDTFSCALEFSGGVSTDPNGNISSFSWSLENPSGITVLTGDSFRIDYIFNEIGTYKLSLNVADSEGLNDTTDLFLNFKEEKPFAVPKIISRIDDTLHGTSNITFNIDSVISADYDYELYRNNTNHNDTGDLSFKWILDDENGDTAPVIFTGKEISYLFPEAKTYSPKLEICKYCDDGNEANDLVTTIPLDSIVVELETKSFASLSFDSLIHLEEENCTTNSKLIGEVTDTHIEWLYKAYFKDENGNLYLEDHSQEINDELHTNHGLDGISLLDAPVSFTKPGQYTLTRYLDGKTIFSETLTVSPNQIPVPKIDLDYNEATRTVNVSAEASYDPKASDIVAYTWEFGDASVANGETASHTYNVSSSFDTPYYIKLTVTDENGLSSSAFSRAVIVKAPTLVPATIPSYLAADQTETSSEDILADDDADDLTFSEIVNKFENLSNTQVNQSHINELKESLPIDNSGGAFCGKEFNNGLQILGVEFGNPAKSPYQGMGSKLLYIHGKNFCRKNHTVKINGLDRNSSYISKNLIVARARADDLNQSNITVKVKHSGSNNNFSDELTINLPPRQANTKTLDLLDGNSYHLATNNKDRFQIEGDAKHFFSNKGAIFYTGANGILRTTHLASNSNSKTKTKIAVRTNGNSFDRIQIKVGDTIIKDKTITAGNKFKRIVSDEFIAPASGALPIEIKFYGANEVLVEGVDLYTSPPAPEVTKLRLSKKPHITKALKDNLILNMASTPNTAVKAVLVNRQTQTGNQAGNYKILDAKEFTTDANGMISGNFRAINFKEGTYCSFFYLDNGSISNQTIKDYLDRNAFNKYKNKFAQGKFAFMSQADMDYLKANALNPSSPSTAHGACFSGEQNINLKIVSPSSDEIILQANNQLQEIKFTSNLPVELKEIAENIESGLGFKMYLINGENIENSNNVINLKLEAHGSDTCTFRVDPSLIGDYNLVAEAEYFDPVTNHSYWGETNKRIRIIADQNPVAKVTTVNTDKLILKSSNKKAERAEFSALSSYDPNAEIFPGLVEGIKAYSWVTEYKEDDTKPNYELVATPYPQNVSNYFIGPSTAPGIYRSSLEVADYSGRTDTAFSDSVQIVKASQKLLTSLSLEGAEKILQPDADDTKTVTLKANLKVTGSKKDVIQSLNYKFNFGDGTEELGSIDPASINLNHFVILPEFNTKVHTYTAEGEYLPELEATVIFTDGYRETWTVSAGTIAITNLPNHVSFTAKLDNKGDLSFETPGFNANFVVENKAIFNTNVLSFGWDFGDGNFWTYSGSQAELDFLKASKTSQNHVYNDVGTYEPKFWVQTSDSGASNISFALQPLIIQVDNIPAINPLKINNQELNIEVHDEEILNIEAGLTAVENISYIEVVINKLNATQNLYHQSYISGIEANFVKDLQGIYLAPSPDPYFLDFIVQDTYGRRITSTKEFIVKGAERIGEEHLDLDTLMNYAEITSANGILYSPDIYHQIPVTLYKPVKNIKIFNNNQLYKEYINPKHDENPDLSVELFDNIPNEIALEIELKNGKLIKTPPYKVILDDTAPHVQIDSPVHRGVYGENNLILSGEVEEDNLYELYYRVNDNNFLSLEYTAVEGEVATYSFSKDIVVTNNLDDPILIEIMAIDKAGNRIFEHNYFQIVPESDFTSLGAKFSLKADKDLMGYPDFIVRSTDKAAVFLSSAWDYDSGQEFDIDYNFTVFDKTVQGADFIDTFCPGAHFTDPINGIQWFLGNNTLLDPKNTRAEFMVSPYMSFFNPSSSSTGYNYGNTASSNLNHKLNRYVSNFGETVTRFTKMTDTNVSAEDATSTVISQYYNFDIESTPSLEHPGDAISAVGRYGLLGPFNSINYEGLYNPNSPQSTDASSSWSEGFYTIKQDVAGTMHDIIGRNLERNCTGTSIYLDNLETNIRINGNPKKEEIINGQIISQTPEVIYSRHNIDNLIYEFDLKTLDAPSVNHLTLATELQDGTYRREENDKFNFEILNTYESDGFYVSSVRLIANDLGYFDNKTSENSLQITYSNPNSTSLTTNVITGIIFFNVESTPKSYAIAKLEDLFPEGTSESILDEKQNKTSTDPKQIRLTIYHVADGLSDVSDVTLNKLKITKTEKDGDEKVVFDEAPINTSGTDTVVTDFMDFQFEATELLGPDAEYPEYHKTTFIANNVTILEAGEYEIDFNLGSFDSNADFDRKVPTRTVDDYYEVNPHLVELSDFSINPTNAIFFETFIEDLNSKRMKISSRDFTVKAKYEFPNLISTTPINAEFEYTTENSSGEEELFESKIQYSNRKTNKIKLEPALNSDLSYEDDGTNKFVNLNLHFDVEKNRNTILQQTQFSKTGIVNLFRLPISIDIKSELGQDIELHGLFDSVNSTKIGIMDYPHFVDKPNNPPRLKLKLAPNGTPKLAAKFHYGNNIGKKNDRLELVMQLKDEFNNDLGDPYNLIHHPSRETRRFSQIKGNSYENTDPVFSKTVLKTKDLIKFAPADFKEWLVPDEDDPDRAVAKRVSIKIHRARDYLDEFHLNDILTESEADSYYPVEDSDQIRHIIVDIENDDNANSCFIELADGTRYKNYDLTDLSELDDIKIYFESESKNKSRIWVRDQNDDDHSFGFTGAPFAHLDILEAQSTDVVGNLVELKEGTFILERIVVPEATVNDDAPFDINFIVDKHDSSLLLDSSVEQLASAAFCKVHYVGDISDASIIIDGLDDTPNAVTKVKADAGHLVNITTDLPSSIHGVSVYFDDINDTGANRINTRVVDNTITIDLKDYFSREHNLNEEHSLIAQLKYEDEFGDPAWGEPEYRRFKIVDGAEPKITFGHEDDLGNTNGVYPNVIFAVPNSNHPFVAEVSMEDIVDPVNSDYSFRLVNLTPGDGDTAEEIYDITNIVDDTPAGAAEGVKVFTITESLPFNNLGDINVYKLEVLENGQALFQSRLFLLTDNPKLEVEQNEDLHFDETNLETLEINAQINNIDIDSNTSTGLAFPRAATIEFETYISGDKNNGTDKVYAEDILAHNDYPTFSQDFELDVPATGDPGFNFNTVVSQGISGAINLARGQANHGVMTTGYTAVPLPTKVNDFACANPAFSFLCNEMKDRLTYRKDNHFFDSEIFFDIEIYKGNDSNPLDDEYEMIWNGEDVYNMKLFATKPGEYYVDVYSFTSLNSDGSYNGQLIGSQFFEFTSTNSTDTHYYPKSKRDMPSYRTELAVPLVDMSTSPNNSKIDFFYMDFTYVDPDTGDTVSFREPIPGLFITDDDADHCLVEKVRKKKYGKLAPAIINAVVYKDIKEWLQTGLSTQSRTLEEVNKPDGLNAGIVSIENIVTDFRRILPKITVGSNESAYAMEGYCESLAELIVNKHPPKPEKIDPFRFFEAKNRKQDNDSRNYVVYFIRPRSFIHIVDAHGKDSPFRNESPGHKYDSKFYDNNIILPTLKKDILNSTVNRTAGNDPKDLRSRDNGRRVNAQTMIETVHTGIGYTRSIVNDIPDDNIIINADRTQVQTFRKGNRGEDGVLLINSFYPVHPQNKDKVFP